MDPGYDVAQKIASVTGLALGTVVFNGPIRETPARAVFCLAYGGPPPDDIVGNPSQSYRYPQVLVRVRDAQGNFRSGETLARQVFNAIHLAQVSGYLDCRVIESHPLHLGKNDHGQEEWSFTVQLLLRE